MAVITGLKNLYLAELTKDTGSEITYSTPVRMPNVQDISIEPQYSDVQIPGDDTVIETISDLHTINVGIGKAQLAEEERAWILGDRKIASGALSGMVATSDGSTAPYFAVGYERTLSNGDARLVWILKTRFKENSDQGETKKPGEITPQYSALSGVATRRITDNEIRYTLDVSAADIATKRSVWFSAATVQTMATAATQVHSCPVAKVTVGTSLPESGIVGEVFVNSSSKAASYWDGAKWVECPTA